jgi:hypothetical protein
MDFNRVSELAATAEQNNPQGTGASAQTPQQPEPPELQDLPNEVEEP